MHRAVIDRTPRVQWIPDLGMWLDERDGHTKGDDTHAVRGLLRRPRDPLNWWDLTAWPVVVPLRLMLAQQELARGKASTRR
jgi:hypothetical protein